MLNAGLGDDNITVKLAAGPALGADGFFVLNTSGGSATGDPVTLCPACCSSDRDTGNAHDSTLPLVIFGGFDKDKIVGGQGNDIIAGDLARVQYAAVPSTCAVPGTCDVLVAQFGYGGRGDIVSDQVLDPRWAYSFVPDLAIGGDDTLHGNGGRGNPLRRPGNDAHHAGAADDLRLRHARQ